jgi:hypothetical protein
MTAKRPNSLHEMLKDDYSLDDVRKILAFLEEKGTLCFPSFENGLFPAAIAADAQNTGYKYAWIRDNVFIAYAHFISGQSNVAIRNLCAQMKYFKKYKFRFERVVDTQARPSSVMERPNIRFNGRSLAEVDEPWEHAQNDALGYFLWLYCKLAMNTIQEDRYESNQLFQEDDIEMLALFALYFLGIRYWEDEDSGHWEEGRKIAASSIGVVIAGLKALRRLCIKVFSPIYRLSCNDKTVTAALLDELIARGVSAMNNILPSECIQPGSRKRRFDSALLFLVYPLELVKGEMAETIVSDVINNLQGDLGVRRYSGDTFWCRDFQDLPKEVQTSIYTNRQKWLKSNNKLVVAGEEAQWCIFDSIISALYGRRFQTPERKIDHLKKQIIYFNRALRQVTYKGSTVKVSQADGRQVFIEIDEYKCPELYYIQEDRYSPNVTTPLLWTQANLIIALRIMEQSLELLS